MSWHLPKIHLEIWEMKANPVLKTLTKMNMNSSFVELKCFHPKSIKNRNTIISMKHRNTITELIFLISPMKMLKWSLTGSTKNLHVKTGVLKMSEMTTALQIWANNLFFIDLFQSDTTDNKSLFHLKLLMKFKRNCKMQVHLLRLSKSTLYNNWTFLTYHFDLFMGSPSFDS